jgi:hypothetical protein
MAGPGRRDKPGTIGSSNRLGFFKPEDDTFPLDFGLLEISQQSSLIDLLANRRIRVDPCSSAANTSVCGVTPILLRANWEPPINAEQRRFSGGTEGSDLSS